jgi:predicted DCC family thiol-disulfide oxidoreductase YuxK
MIKWRKSALESFARHSAPEGISGAGSPPGEPPQEPETGWLLYDGECGICSRWVPAWAPTLRRYGLAVAPLQSSWVSKRTGLTESDLLNDIQLLERQGQLHSGPDAYRYLMRRIWWASPFYLLSILPGLRSGFNWAYRTFARHRTRISASCGLPGPH